VSSPVPFPCLRNDPQQGPGPQRLAANWRLRPGDKTTEGAGYKAGTLEKPYTCPRRAGESINGRARSTGLSVYLQVPERLSRSG